MKNKVIYAILSFMIAFGLWFYVITVVSPESEATYYNVPVILNNESVMNEKGLMIETNKQPTVTLRLRGNRSDLNSLKTSDITLMVDLAKINDPGEQKLRYSIAYPGNFASNAFEVLSQSPDQITLNIVEWATKEVDVTVAYQGSVPQDYIVDKEETVLDYEKVTITGPKAVIDQITEARVGVDLNGQTETISQSYRYTLCNAAGEPVNAAAVQTNVAEVNVTVKIQRVKELQLMVEIDTQNCGLAEDVFSIAYSQQTIKVAGSERALANLGDTLIVGKVTITDILNNGTFVFKIPDFAEGIKDLTNVEFVTVSITYPGMDKKDLTISDINPINTPEGFSAEVETKTLSLKLLGPAAQIALIQPEHIKIEVDLTGAEAGNNPYKVQFAIEAPGFENVGVLITDKVWVVVTNDPIDVQ